jgi:hypothetical protein
MSSEHSTPSASRRYALVALKLAVSVALLALLFSRIDVGRLWLGARRASLPWISIALMLYVANVLASVWRWWLLLEAQDVSVPTHRLVGSFLVALFFNNFLPSNIGGDVIRISDTARPAGSKTLATTIVLFDRVLGLMGLVLVSALGASMTAATSGRASLPIWPAWLWMAFALGACATAPAIMAPAGFSRVLQPLTVFHPEWIGERIDKLTASLVRFRDRPGTIAGAFVGAVFVQAITVAFYVAVAWALHIPITPWNLAVIVPLSFVVQLLPVSVNGFGVREATFSFYFTRIGLPIESALLLSLGATVLVMLFSLSGAAVYIARKRA